MLGKRLHVSYYRRPERVIYYSINMYAMHIKIIFVISKLVNCKYVTVLIIRSLCKYKVITVHVASVIVEGITTLSLFVKSQYFIRTCHYIIAINHLAWLISWETIRIYIRTISPTLDLICLKFSTITRCVNLNI